MRRVGVLICAVLVLFLISSVNPSMSSIPAAIVTEPQSTKDFGLSADGGESEYSIPSFSETTEDNTFYVPDDFSVYRDDFHSVDRWTNHTDGSIVSDGTYGDVSMLADTNNDVWTDGWDTNVSVDGNNFWIWADVEEAVAVTRLGLRVYYDNDTDLGEPVYSITAYKNPADDDWSELYGFNMSPYIGVGFHIYKIIVYVEYGGYTFDESFVRFDWLAITNSDAQPVDYTGYSEPFLDVSDFTTSDCSISTDGDVATITENGAGSTGRAYASFSSTDFFEYYYEFRIESMTATTANLEFWDGAAYNTLKTFTAAGTYKGIISDTDAATMQRIGFLVGSEGGNVKPDYLRVGKSTEMGWAHDGSTTAGTEEEARSGWSYSISSDDDLLTMIFSRSGGSSTYGSVYLNFDTTATEADLETSYYPFLGLTWECSALTANDFYVIPCIDGKTNADDTELVGGQKFTSTFSQTTHRINTAALSGSTGTIGLRFIVRGEDTESATLKVDWTKAYSIANFSVDFNTRSKTTDVLYVDANNDLVFDRTSAVYCRINIDPALSVATATHNVWNLTISNVQTTAGSYDWIFEEYVSGWTGTDDADETRGTLTSGTMTDFRLWSIESFTLSAIKFIEDGTAPDILDKYLDPSIPADDEAVTVIAVAYDAVEVYEVIINAIVYPTGFSDVDYSMTETAQEHVFTYDFDTLTAGYYLFQITANDGANTYSEYISVRVREAEITISPITFFGVGEDFTQMQMSFDINKDCSYTIYEASASYAEADTHTGSVSEGWSNIAWDKISVVDTSANFSIKFANGSLSTWVNGSYSIAQTTFYVSTVTQMVSLDTVTVTGRITKLGAYQVYDDLDVLKDYGSITDLDFKVQFTRWGGYDEQNHDFVIKFTNGSQTCWYNSSFYAFKKPVVAAFQTTDPNTLYAFTLSFWTLIAVVAIGGMVAVDFYRKEVK